MATKRASALEPGDRVSRNFQHWIVAYVAKIEGTTMQVVFYTVPYDQPARPDTHSPATLYKMGFKEAELLRSGTYMAERIQRSTRLTCYN